MSRSFLRRSGWVAVIALAVGCSRTETREITEYHPPKATDDDGLADDRLEDKHNTFDPALVDRRPLGDWLINQSEAVVRLDVPLAKPDADEKLLRLSPSYAAAVTALEPRNAGDGEQVLPSVNMVDGKAKQFDDGLYAALDQAYYRGLNARLLSHVELVKRILDKVGPASPAAPFLAAGLTLAKQEVSVADKAARDRLVGEFLENPASKPISFYTWTETLQECWQFMRFFQKRLSESDPAVPALVAALTADSTLLADYRQAANFYARLTNPPDCLSLADLVGIEPLTAARLTALRQERGVAAQGIALFPPSTSRESVLFARLFGNGLPPHANLMRELVRRIRSGEVDLSPRENSGWYDHQVYALETLLLSEKGEESHKLWLSKSYKKRMLEAFQALITKRRETHARQLEPRAMGSAIAPPNKPDHVTPRLRVEPCPTFYLRTARAYSFLLNFLDATIGPESLAALRGLRQEGDRSGDLATELAFMRDLFYGLYLVSCEDIGHATALRDGEVDSLDRCYDAAADWLPKSFADPDLAQDTRVPVPIAVDVERKATRLWVTLGVRLTRLEASFATPPRIKPKDGAGDWEPVESQTLRSNRYLIPVDEFAEVELRGLVALSREELRKICDQAKTKEAIIAALQRR